MTRRILHVLTFGLVALTLTACASATVVGTEVEQYSAADAQAFLAAAPADLVILDVRTPDEFDAGHLSGAVNVDYYAADFTDQLDALDRDVPYFVYCRSGNRSEAAVDLMQDLGFAEIHELQGGIVAWAEAGLGIQR